MRKPWKKKRWWILVGFVLPLFLLILGVFLVNIWVTAATEHNVFATVDEIEKSDVALVLGTSKSFVGGQENLHFKHRMQAAADLYRSGKVQRLLVSGHHGSKYYNEPKDMAEALIVLGVPGSDIMTDPAGHRTLDSVVRADKVFGFNEYVIVSDGFHVGRALFIARHYGINASALACEDVSYGLSAKARFREYFARVKAVLDLYILDTQPKHLEAPEEIHITSTGS